MAFPSTYNFNYYRGDTHEIVIRPKTANGESFPLAGYLAAYTIANTRGPSGTQYVASAVVNDVNDLVTCTIFDSVGRSLSPGSYVYDVEIQNGLQVYTILTGSITVTDDITGAL
jgi:hypothetical protein